MTTGQNLCAMCEKHPAPADHGLLCAKHRAEDDALNEMVARAATEKRESGK